MKGNDMNDAEYRELVETSWRRPLNEEEQARLRGWLAVNPQAQPDWEDEVILNQALARLPDPPVSSNFAALVMQAIDRDETAALRPRTFMDRLREMFRRRAPRVAWALALAMVVWIGVRQHQRASRHELATGLATLVNVAAVQDPKALQDMEAIQQLSYRAAPEDEEIFKVLSQ